MPSVSARFVGLERTLDRLADSIEHEVIGVARRAAERVAETARADHPYTDRSGDLTGSIEALPPTGSYLAGSLRVATLAGMPYASYLEARASYRFLLPAWQRVEVYVAHDADESLRRAATAAGLK